MRQQVLSSEHTPGILGKKSSGKALKGEDFGENGRRLVGDGLSLNDDKQASKMPGGRLKGSLSTYHSKDHKEYKDPKDHKENKDTRDTKDHKDQKEHKDYNHNKTHEDGESKAPESTENHVKDEEEDGQKRRAQDGGETLLQWGQRKRPRYREPSGTLKTSIRADRRVVRADKQIASQPAAQPRGNSLRPPNVTSQEPASGSGKRTAEEVGASGSAAPNSDHNYGQSSSGHLRSSITEKEDRQQQALPDNPDKIPACPASTSGGNLAPNIFSHGRPEMDSFTEKGLAPEKMNLELFEWPKIVISLTRKEKEDDFMAIKGAKLPQRPKRRPKTVEKNVNFISPGTWLCDLTRERYEVREKKAVKKKPRGLKAMGSVDSDSE